MATFKPGQRVKCIRWVPKFVVVTSVVGKEATVVGYVGPMVSVDFDMPGDLYKGVPMFPEELVPLTPPDTWASDKVKKLTKLDPDFIREESKRELREVIREQRG